MTKTFIKRVESLLPLCWSFLLFALLSIITYLILCSFYEKRARFKLTILHNNIKEILKRDLESAIFGIEGKFTLFLNYKYHKKPYENETSVTVTDQNTIIINSSSAELTLDVQELKEFVDKILPIYVVYKISLNDQIIAARGLSNEQYQSTESLVRIDDYTNLSIHLSIDKNSEHYLKITDKFYKDYFSLIALIFVIIAFCLAYYYSIKNNHQVTQNRLKGEIDKLKNNNYSLIEYIKVCKKLEDMYINSGFNQAESYVVDANKFAKDVEYYFNYDKFDVVIKCNINDLNIKTHCSAETFYQLIFSLVNLLITFMNGQSNEQKSIAISLSAEQILLEFESFALDEEKMIYLAENVLMLPKNFFLLDCRSLFQYLKNNNFKYIFHLEGEYNHKIEIITSNTDNSTNDSRTDHSKIIKFRHYKDV